MKAVIAIPTMEPFENTSADLMSSRLDENRFVSTVIFSYLCRCLKQSELSDFYVSAV